MELLLTPRWGINPFSLVVVLLFPIVMLFGLRFVHWARSVDEETQTRQVRRVVLWGLFLLFLLPLPFVQQTTHHRSLMFNQIEVRGVQAQIKDQLERQYDAKIVTLGSTEEHDGVREGYRNLVKGDRVEVRWLRGGTEELCAVLPQGKYKPVGNRAALRVDVFCGNALVKAKEGK